MILRCFTGLLASFLFCAAIRGLAAETNAPLTVCTYNLRFASASGPNAWALRRPLMRELLRDLSPDVLGTQEGVYSQLKDIAADLPGYEWIGLGRDGGSRGEFMAVFYRTSRLEPLEFDHFWLSDTPDVIGSSTWGNRVRRMVTWVKFRDRASREEFYFVNTHFDHQVQQAREKSAELVRNRIAALTNAPVLLVGDFNAAAHSNRVHSILTADGFLRDLWDEAPVRRGENLGTFNGFQATPVNGPRIDWILARGNIRVSTIEIVPFSKEGRWPSDHLPVVAQIVLGAAPD